MPIKRLLRRGASRGIRTVFSQRVTISGQSWRWFTAPELGIGIVGPNTRFSALWGYPRDAVLENYRINKAIVSVGEFRMWLPRSAAWSPTTEHQWLPYIRCSYTKTLLSQKVSMRSDDTVIVCTGTTFDHTADFRVFGQKPPSTDLTNT